MTIHADSLVQAAAAIVNRSKSASRAENDAFAGHLPGLRAAATALGALGADVVSAMSTLKVAATAVDGRRDAFRLSQTALIADRAHEAGMSPDEMRLEPCTSGDRVIQIVRSGSKWIDHQVRDNGDAVQIEDESGVLGLVDAHETHVVDGVVRFGPVCSIPIDEIEAALDHDDGINILTKAGRFVRISVAA